MKRITVLLVFFVFLGVQVFAQSTVTGTVTDAGDGQPIPGVTVSVKGFSNAGTLTDFDGKYSIKVPEGGANLVYSFVGMKTQSLAIGGQAVINVTMHSDDVMVGDVIVTAVGIKKDTKKLGYGVQTIDSDELSEASNADVVNSISGRVAGVQVVSSSGTAGSSAYITIRGSASLSGNNQPLFVVDGVPIITGGGGGDVGGVATSGRSIDLNPDDIASMSVLKGGAATALYGLKAANGAIVITTKSGGNKNKVSINFHTAVGFDQVSQLPAMQDKYAQGSGGNFIPAFSMTWGPEISSLQHANFDEAYPTYLDGILVDANDPLANGTPAQAYDPYDFFQTGTTYTNNMSISTGNENTSYFFSMGNLSQTGIVPNNLFSRTSVRLNSETKINDKLTTGAQMSYINSEGNFIQQGSNVSGVMLGLLRTPASFNNAGGYELADGSQRNYRGGGGYDNPYWTANKNSFDDRTNRFMGNLNLAYKALDWMTFTYRLGTDWYNRSYSDIFAVGSRAYSSGLYGEYSRMERVLNSDLIMNIQKELTEDLGLGLIVGNNFFESTRRYLYGEADGLSIPEFYSLSNTAAQSTIVDNYNYRTSAVYSELSLDYKDMLYLSLTGRNDWSTTMPEENVSAFYPSASLGFIFTELSALKGNSVLSYGKLRGSWAKTANIATAYRTTTGYSAAGVGDGWTDGFAFPFNGMTGFSYDNTLGSADLKHETQTTIEAGVELKLFNNRVGIDAGYFRNDNSDLLLYVPVAETSGFSSMYTNAATMFSEGSEFIFYVTPIKTNDVTWDVFVNFSKYINKVTELADGVDNLFLGGFTDPQIRAVAGQEYRSIYGYDWVRDAAGNVVINDDPSDSYPDGFPMTDDSGMKALGTVNPEWTANISNSVSYKGFKFSFLVDIKKGGLMYNGTRFTMNYFGTSAETLNREVSYTDYGTIDYDNTPAENIVVWEGVLGHLDANGNVVSSGTINNTEVVNDEAWYRGQGGNFGGGPTIGAIEKTDWVRLREVSLSYDFGATVLGDDGFIKGLNVYFTGRNLWINTPYTGVDPETSLLGASNAQGMDYFNMPGSKTYTFGLKFKF